MDLVSLPLIRSRPVPLVVVVAGDGPEGDQIESGPECPSSLVSHGKVNPVLPVICDLFRKTVGPRGTSSVKLISFRLGWF